MSTSTLVTRSRPRLTPSDFWKIESMLTANGYSRETIEGMLNVTLFARLKNVIEGRAEIVNGEISKVKIPGKVIEEADAVVNLGVRPRPIVGLEVVKNTLGKKMRFTSSNILVYTSLHQKRGKVDAGEKLMGEFEEVKSFNSVLFDFLLKQKNQSLIPQEWKKFYMFFWGTIYRCVYTKRLCVRGLCWGSHGWEECLHWVDQGWSPLRLALVPTNQHIRPQNIAPLHSDGLGDYHLVDRLKAA